MQRSDAVKYATFRAILKEDLEAGEFDDSGSAASALLWLKRSLSPYYLCLSYVIM